MNLSYRLAYKVGVTPWEHTGHGFDAQLSGLLDAIPVPEGGRALDIGCGTAVLAMAAARLWPVTVLASDIDAVAVDTAAANVIANGLDGRVICIEAAGFGHQMLEDNAPYDLVLANILKQPLIDLAPQMASVVAPKGKIILSGILVTQADEVVKTYGMHGFALDQRDDLGDWSALTLTRQG